MTDVSQLAKIVEFIHRTDLLEKMKKSGSSNNQMLNYIISVAVDHNWNVDEAVDVFLNRLSNRIGKSQIAEQVFNPKAFMSRQMELAETEYYNVEEFNSLYFGFDLNKSNVVTDHTHEP